MLIKNENAGKIMEIIKKAEGKARERTITYIEIFTDIARIEKKLGIKKKDMVGIKAVVDHHAQNFPNAYKYNAQSTFFEVVRKKNGWDLVRVYRDYTRREGKEFCLYLTEDAENAILEKHKCFGFY